MARDLPIVRSDFPSSRRGWEPDAVRAHLAEVEVLVDELRRQAARAASPPAAEAASAQVREIVAAAERSAEAIRAGAEQEAQRIREAAVGEAASAREAVRSVAERARELERQLAEMAGALRSGVPEAAPRQEPAAARAAAPAAPPAPPADGGDRTDEEAARLVALDLALSGRTRAEVDRHLAEHYDLPDRNAVLVDVFQIVEG